MRTQTINFAALPLYDLSPRDKAVRQVLRDARGFFRTDGLTQQEVRQRLLSLPVSIYRPAFGRRIPTLGSIHRALVNLASLGLAMQVTTGCWQEGR